MNKQSDKKMIRKEVLAKRDLIKQEEHKCASRLLKERICGHPWFAQATVLLAFVSYSSEIDTTEIILEALNLGKKVYVPRVEGSEIQFYCIADLNCLQEGYRGIREPAGDAERFLYCPEDAGQVLMIIPGAVFDKKGNRCGYGKGFYDRYLAGKEALQLRTIGVGFQCQLVEELPVQEWDIRPCQVICV